MTTLKVALFLPFPERKDSVHAIEKMEEKLGVQVIPYGLGGLPTPESLLNKGVHVLAYIHGTTTRNLLAPLEKLAKQIRLPMLTLGKSIHDQSAALAPHIQRLAPPAPLDLPKAFPPAAAWSEPKVAEPPEAIVEEPPPPPPPSQPDIELSVSPQSIFPLCAIVQVLLEKGYTWEQATPHIARFWKDGKPEPAKLRRFVYRLVTIHNRCPPFFRTWWEKHERESAALSPTPLTDFDPDAPDPLPIDIITPPGAPPASPDLDPGLVELYDELEKEKESWAKEAFRLGEDVIQLENQLRAAREGKAQSDARINELSTRAEILENRLKEARDAKGQSDAQIQELFLRVEDLKNALAQASKTRTQLEMELELARLAPPPAPAAAPTRPTITAEQIKSIRTLVESGFLKREEVFDRLLALLDGGKE